jgi:DNA polymerase III sliding clamp (beta) subunit (PCNA family)
MKATINANDLKRLIAATEKFVERNCAKTIYRFIRLEFSKEFSRVTAISTDGYRLSLEHAVCSDIDEDFTAYIKPQLPPSYSKYDNATIELKDSKCFIEVNGSIVGYKQPHDDFLDYKETVKNATDGAPALRIGFNGNLLISALQEAKTSCGNSFRKPVVLEFRGSLSPAIIRTNDDDMKLVLPVRLEGDK